MADALGVSVVREPVYPYEEFPPLDDVMSYIIGSSIQWGSDPRITFVDFADMRFSINRKSLASIEYQLNQPTCNSFVFILNLSFLS